MGTYQSTVVFDRDSGRTKVWAGSIFQDFDGVPHLCGQEGSAACDLEPADLDLSWRRLKVATADLCIDCLALLWASELEDEAVEGAPI